MERIQMKFLCRKRFLSLGYIETKYLIVYVDTARINVAFEKTSDVAYD